MDYTTTDPRDSSYKIESTYFLYFNIIYQVVMENDKNFHSSKNIYEVFYFLRY